MLECTVQQVAAYIGCDSCMKHLSNYSRAANNLLQLKLPAKPAFVDLTDYLINLVLM
jgi:hypothetical protein